MKELKLLLARNLIHVVQIYVTPTVYVRIYKEEIERMAEEAEGKGATVEILESEIHVSDNGLELLEVFVRISDM